MKAEPEFKINTTGSVLKCISDLSKTDIGMHSLIKCIFTIIRFGQKSQPKCIHVNV